MKKIFVLCCLTLCFWSNSFAQTNQGSNPSSIDIAGPKMQLDGTGVLDAVVVNSGYDPMVPGTYRVTITVEPGKLEIIDPSYITAENPDWSVVSFGPNQLVLVNANGPIDPSEIVGFAIRVNVIAPAVGDAIISLRSSITPGRGFQAGNTDNSADDDIRTGAIALPVKLISFNAVKENTIVALSWSTTEEVNSDRFEVERSINGENWNRIGSVASNNDSNTLKNYGFSDKSPESGENLYRLKMVDRDKTFAYSSIRTVTMDGVVKDLSVYPNPSSDFIRLRDAQNVASVSIVDLNGKTVYATSQVSKGEISVKNLTTGMYTVRIETKGGAQSVQKLVVAR
jgi:hypothetical protein